MSSNTDFYLGRGEDAEWIGSLHGECYPENFLAVPPLRLAVTATTEAIFRAAVADAFVVWEEERLGRAYRREGGWPWPWYSSHNSSWIITFDPGDGAVFATVGGGVRWHRIDPSNPWFPEGDDPLGPPDLYAWLRKPAAPPSVPMPLMREVSADMPIIGGDAG
ncbi:hypothetical protein NQK81_27830 [Amycolatopsis roodepoortensis]|uniref:hypothetical protein n=1 Tax=Amycolatopsis roodepoortensis TaxID=700274 RepID=UPI00214B0D26|nr:hypothetical protein [Amycolatopsis roodepoortensis]UUV28587.1 hypothetical protein NQK81_27830 [Amycolatopsis roodepoortensis]